MKWLAHDWAADLALLEATYHRDPGKYTVAVFFKRLALAREHSADEATAVRIATEADVQEWAESEWKV